MHQCGFCAKGTMAYGFCAVCFPVGETPTFAICGPSTGRKPVTASSSIAMVLGRATACRSVRRKLRKMALHRGAPPAPLRAVNAHAPRVNGFR